MYKFYQYYIKKIFLGKTKICCTKCQKKCSGEVLRVADKYFHKQCFQCSTCRKSLASGGFFSKDNTFYCTSDYQRLFGTKCAACKTYVEGEVVSTMGNTYHQKCFTCSRCNQPFQSGSKVSKILEINNDKEKFLFKMTSGVNEVISETPGQCLFWIYAALIN